MSAEERRRLGTAIAALQAQRRQLGDAVVDALLAPALQRLAVLSSPAEASAAAAAALQQLKQVSILFLDVVGSTSLVQRLDPESVGAVMDDALARGAAVVQAHGGQVLRFAGDNILAVFGAERAREDDAERAVRCGLALLELGRTLGAEVLARHGHAGFDVRVGVHTGGVLLGGGVEGEHNIQGLAVNIAARMEQTAAPGSLRISQDTHAQLRGLFDCEVQPAMTVKGLDRPIGSLRVRRAWPPAARSGGRGIAGLATTMIGRERELQRLQQALLQMRSQRRFMAVTVVAEAGLGKSRLLCELEAWSRELAAAPVLLRGRATPRTQGQPFGLLRDIVAWRFSIADDDRIEVARDKLEQGIAALFPAVAERETACSHAHLLGHLIGIDWRDSRHLRGILDDPRQIRDRAFHAALQWFGCAGGPVLLLVDDLHWADAESLDFLSHLADAGRDIALLMVGGTRPELFERRPDWCDSAGPRAERHLRVDLAALDDTCSRRLADELLRRLPAAPAALHERITAAAEGNPFYMEELVRMLIDQGAIDTAAAAWTLDAVRLLDSHVPGTLTGVLQARLDTLPAALRLALQQASCIGQVFWDQALGALDAAAQALLPMLVARELVLPRGVAVEGLREYRFSHALLHQVTYDTVLRANRRDWHGRVASWLAELGEGRAGVDLATTAEHFDRAGDAARAGEFYARAAEHARERFAHDAAQAHVRRALELLPATPAGEDATDTVTLQQRWRLLRVREQTLDLQGRREAQSADVHALEQLAEQLDDDARRARAACRRSGLAMRLADHAGQALAARRAIEAAARAGDHFWRLQGERLLALAEADQGEIAAARERAAQGLAQARAAKLHLLEAQFLELLAGLAEMQGEVMDALSLSRQALQVQRARGNRRGEAISLFNTGVASLNLGDLVQARHDFEATLAVHRSNGDRIFEGVALTHLSQLALWQGDPPAALALACAAQALLAAAQSRDRLLYADLSAAEAEFAAGRVAAARGLFERSLATALELGDAARYDANAGLACAALSMGEVAAARQVLEPLLAHRLAGGALVATLQPRLIEWRCHQVLAAAGEAAAAADWLACAWAALQSQAATIPDEAGRQAFLSHIPHHRWIVAPCAANRVSLPG